MKIVYSISFMKRLSKYIDFIANDNIKIAKKVRNQILEKTKAIPANPYLS